MKTDAEQNQQLRQWAARQCGDTKSLEERIIAAAMQGKPPRRWTHGMSFLAGVAATAIAVLTLIISRAWSTDSQLARLLIEEKECLEQRRASLSKIFNETERVFGPNLQWIAESKTTAELGLSEAPSGGEPMLLRVTVVRKGTDGQWQRVWGMELVARNESVLQLTEPDGAQRLALSLSRLDEHLAVVESFLVMSNGFSLTAQNRDILRFGEAKSIRRVSGDGTEYRILQTLTPANQES